MICRDCKFDKKPEDMVIRDNKPSNWCKDCRRIYHKRYDSKRSDKSKKNKLQKKLERLLYLKKEVWKFLLDNPCVDCGESNPIVLEFDHIDEKFMEISEMIRHGFSIEKIFEEIQKCEVRCANCHRAKTAKDFNWFTG